MSRVFHRPLRVEFNHCDPAGIVFYPRYFEMANATVENFFRGPLQMPFEALMATGRGVPTASLKVDFHAPSRLGDLLDWQLRITRLGRASLGLDLQAWGAADRIHRLTIVTTLVHVRLAGGPHPWPDDIRMRLAAFMESSR